MNTHKEPPEEHVERLKEAIRIMDQGVYHWKEAETIIQKILSECPDYTESKFQLVRLWTREMRNSYNIGNTFTNEFKTHPIEEVYQSIDHLLQDVIRSAPNHPGPYYCFACWACFPFKKSYSDMQKYYAEALSRDDSADPQYYIFHDDVAMAASDENDRDLAIEAFYRAHKTGKESGRTYPDVEPAYTYWKQARLRWQNENK